MNSSRSHAVVIGGSMAGMLAARVLADHFEQVTLLERDHFSETEQYRRGLPQAPHLHGLLARGLQIIEELFPGIRKELTDAGAEEIDPGLDIVWLTPAGWGKPCPGPHFLSCSRPFLDQHIRRRMAKVSNVKIMSGAEVTRLLHDPIRKEITGVWVKFDNGETSQQELAVGANLIVDASGRHSRAPQWLNALGYEAPRETIVNAFLGYATRLYERTEDLPDGAKGILIQSAPPEHPRSGIFFPIENNRLILTLSGGGGDYPSSDEREFLEFARSLRAPQIFDWLQSVKPLTEIRTFRNTQNRLRHYEEMAQLPGRFVLIGDSVCAFNPVYGQGMTTAALGAIELGEYLIDWKADSLGVSFVKGFQTRLAKINILPWSLATGSDCRYPRTEGATRGWRQRLMHAYIDRVIALTTSDVKIRGLWLRIFQMLESPAKLFSPGVLLKVLSGFATRPPTPPASQRFAVRQPTWASTSRD